MHSGNSFLHSALSALPINYETLQNTGGIMRNTNRGIPMEPTRSVSSPPNESGSKLQPEFERQREQMHRQMLSSVSHDLKTPLASVIGSLEIFLCMQNQLPPEKLQTLVHTALQEAYRLDHFVTNILDMGKLENGMVRPRVEMVNSMLVLEECLERLRPILGNAKLNIIPLESDSPLILMTDSTLLIRALSLVIDNALKHGGNPAVVHLSAHPSSTHAVEIRIRDEGPGVDAGMEEAIFNKYTRLSKQDHQKAGTGLGLAICRGIIEILNGSIHLHNHPDGGAEFIIQLNDLSD
jgi:K+-sensing histidine kinase KdpD